jgi:hypothetical protein
MILIYPIKKAETRGGPQVSAFLFSEVRGFANVFVKFTLDYSDHCRLIV